MDTHNAANNIEDTSDFKTEIDKLAEENREIVGTYHTKIYQDCCVTSEMVDTRKAFLDKMIKLLETQKELQQDGEFTSMIVRLKEWYKSLDKIYLKAIEFEKFLETATEELLQVAEKQHKAWEKIETALKKHDTQHYQNYNAIIRSPENEKYAKIYREFISDLRQFLQTNRIFAEEKNSIERLARAYIEHALLEKKSCKEKTADCVNIAAACTLRKMIDVIFYAINVEKQSNSLEPHINLHNVNVPHQLLKKIIELEKEEYSADGSVKEISTVFSGLAFYINTEIDYCILNNILEVDVQDFQKAIKRRYKSIKTEILLGENHCKVSFPDDFSDKMNQLRKYNDLVMCAILEAINSDSYTDEMRAANNSLFVINDEHKSLPLIAEKLDVNSVKKWFGYKDKYARPENSENSEGNDSAFDKTLEDMSIYDFSKMVSFPDWKEHMQIGLDEKDQTRKDVLQELCQLLENINKVLLLLHWEDQPRPIRKVQREYWFKKYPELDRDYYPVEYIDTTEHLCIAFCYAAKMKKLKSILKYTNPSYTFSVVRFWTECLESKNNEYPVLNRENCLIYETTDVGIFGLREKKAHKALKHLQKLIKELNKATKKIGFLLSENEIKAHNELAQKLYSIDVKKDLRPSKALPLTKHMKEIITRVIGNAMFRIARSLEARYKSMFYSISKYLILFDTNIEILESYVPNNAKETLDPFRAYRKENVLNKLNHVKQKKRIKEVKESKKAFIEFTNIILDTEKHIASFLAKTGDTYVRDHVIFYIHAYDFDFSSESSTEEDFPLLQKEEE